MQRRLAIFPLGGALLFPRMHLPLHIFEPRYRAMVSEAMAKDQRIGMIQPSGPGEPAPLFSIGCMGRITEIEALDDGRFNIILAGEARFRVQRELDVPTAFRQVEVEIIEGVEDEPGVLAPSERAALEDEARAFAASLGYEVEWDAVETLDDEMLVNAIAQIAPFDPAAKQALLEADALRDRNELIIQLMQFARRGDGQGSQRLH
ncbi:Lon protease-like protein [Sphingobium sp. B2D3A]|uniref:LON peptidase substrate-binding domain-containing protein n=1 Tax=Sphingobium TaxID=165695 RepID=UPI0015EB9812|nr:Lon protease-like protein [Sphingobium sp. B2D3A]MCW2363190.1 Lon protease-like protein [Sphingobium sp. B10D3B]MCW2386421.1 Lon protease-like protein [Sphingobium sp. B2D3D]MCW2396520.1 Lon protease-like protein [Sphingobium sp. B8D3B]MCW2400130.1 Lon protease-like protein [Sphingobium sp. B10D7B]MCW2407108.1 Lon protease-like protein [Sphingobium xanthum]MCW2420037.1 Lon protease-like protein [Sphingobium sp. B8D3C]